MPAPATSTWQAKSISSGDKKDGSDEIACLEVLRPGEKPESTHLFNVTW